jgi:hypothetical protein
MSENSTVNCEYLVDSHLCKSIVEGEEGLAVREKGCLESVKNLCCYLCSHRESCQISCSYLDKLDASRTVDQKTANVDQEIKQCQERIERLAGLLADGKIGEESYAAATKALENRMEALKKAEANPNVMLSSSRETVGSEDVSNVRPTLLWYLVPFFFGILGGIVGYVGTKDEDKGMADGLLLFGTLWSIILYAFYWIAVSSLILRAR